MNIEIVEFYPIECKEERDILTGTLRVKLPDIGIHILGVFVSKRNDSWFFSLPGRKSEHHETGGQIRYPFVVFENYDEQKQFMAAIKEKAPIFIEKRLVDTENPLIFPKIQRRAEKGRKSVRIEDNSMQAIANHKIATRLWVDPPERKFFATRRKP